MAALESCPKHNMVAYLEKTDGNVEFHEIIDFLTRSSIHYALTVSPVASTMFVEQFWMIAKSKTINNVSYIITTVAGKPVSISEASIRSDLQFNDAAGIDVLPNQAIFDTIQLMGHMELYIENRENERMILDSVLNGPLVWPDFVQEDDITRKKTYAELSTTKKLQKRYVTKSPT
ncbi:hypothetical protein Tco_0701521 [Tanacetum coccineum]